MFEEVNNQKVAASTPETKGNNPIAGQPATESPKGEPVVQDIFANTDKSDANTPPNPQPSDLLAKSLKANSSVQSVNQTPTKSASKAKLVLVILIILVVVAAGVLVYSQYFKKAPAEAIIPESVVDIEENVPASDSGAVVEPPTADIVEPEIISEEPVATDTNFLTEEGELGEAGDNMNLGEDIMPEEPVVINEENTSVPEEVVVDLDSDQDGLSDADEINVYGTNPLKSDTDGDGYLDGDEIKNGYNPLGEGSLSQ